jgi:predicted membrane GTPase involved in stress response
VIFTKQDGAVSKETSQLLMDFPENTRNRSVRKEARRKAELEVMNHVKKLEGELRGMGLADSTTAFLTTSGMLITLDAVHHELTFFRDGNAYS